MNYVKNSEYRDIPFSSEFARDDYCIYSNVSELAALCENHKEELVNCRTIGILQSKEGRYYLSDIITPTEEPLIRVSMVYLKAPPESTIIPYLVQIFGLLQWKNRPVVFAKIIQVLSTPMALRLREAMSSVVSVHLAHTYSEDDENQNSSE